MTSFLDKLLTYYELDYSSYLKNKEKSLIDIPKFSRFPNLKEVTNYIKDSIKQNKKILIYGDYDCDGIMSTSIIYLTLMYGSEYRPGFYIPNREIDGYGLTINNIDKFKKLGYDIIILVDNGISLIEQIDYANSLGIECVILDHHNVGEKLPNAKYIVHPDLVNFGKYNISAGVVSFYFSWAYLEYINPYLLSLGAISTISDVMILQEYNSLIVKEGLKAINKHKFSQIFDLLGNTKDNLNESDLSLLIVPKINSICRVLNDDSRFKIVKYFIDENAHFRILPWIFQINDKRKELSHAKTEDVDFTKPAIFYINPENEGISGLIAANLMTQSLKPTFVLCPERFHPNILKGSARSYNNFNVAESLNKASEVLITHGGHECAGGFSLDIKDYEKFQNIIYEIAKNIPPYVKQYKYIELEYEEINLKNYEIYMSFSPFGQGHEKPLFLLKDFVISNFKKTNDGKHLLFKNNLYSIAYFSYDKEIEKYDIASLLCEFSLNEFRGSKSVQLKVIDFVK